MSPSLVLRDLPTPITKSNYIHSATLQQHFVFAGYKITNIATMAKQGDMTEISLVPLDDNSSGHSSYGRSGSGRGEGHTGYTISNDNHTYNSYSQQRPSMPPNAYYQRQSYIDETPGASPPGTPLTGAGGALPYGTLLPPRYHSHANDSSTGLSSRSASPSPYPQAQTPYVS